METDPKKLRQLRLNQPHMTSAEVYAQMERSLRAASRGVPPKKRTPSANGRKHTA
jgi:Ser/Thr protein kinase RdoA (MazF antagonist)